MYYSRDERRSVDRLATQLFTRKHAHLTRLARRHSVYCGEAGAP